MANFNKICLNCLNFSVKKGICRKCGTAQDQISNPAPALPPGTILDGQYLLGRRLGQGGFGITYSGYDLTEKRKVAVKEFYPQRLASRSTGSLEIVTNRKELFLYSMNRFCEEAQMIYHYRYLPNIIHVYKRFLENGTAYYVMEYLEGEDLRSYLMKRGGRLAYEELLSFILPVLDVLECVHRKNVIHRDISPDNIVLADKVKLIDFGAARSLSARKEKTLTVILKEGFAPEEQYRSKGRQGPWTDIYALSGTMYYCLTGKMVPRAPDRLANDTLEDIRSLGIRLPVYSAEAIMRGLEVRAENRIQTAAEFRSALLGENTASIGFCLTGIRGLYAGCQLQESNPLVIGRSAEQCQLVYPPETRGISKTHCRISPDTGTGRLWLEDLYSSYGTFLNGKRIPGGLLAELHSGDRIQISSSQEFEVTIYRTGGSYYDHNGTVF